VSGLQAILPFAQKGVGYQHFFVWVCIATIPGFVVAKLAKVDPEFGKKLS